MKQKFLDALHADPERYIGEYQKQFGNVLNADDAATLFDDYNKSPMEHREAVHPAATEIRDSLFAKKLSESASPEKNFVVFTAGGNASGKSTVAKLSGAGESAHAVLDSTFSNSDHARHLVCAALASGKRVVIQHVSRPIGESFLGMLKRARTEGRVVSVRQMVTSERGYRKHDTRTSRRVQRRCVRLLSVLR